MSEQPLHAPRAHSRLAIKLAMGALLMFGFAFAMVPFYDVFCEITGLNGRTGQEKANAATAVDPRLVTVEFNGDVMPGLPWHFEPRLKKIQVHPGERITIWYRVKNLADRPVEGRAVPSVSPSAAARHFRKIECFCFTQQRLNAGEEKEMPVTFVVARELPAEVGVMTLSYAFFPGLGTTVLTQENKR